MTATFISARSKFLRAPFYLNLLLAAFAVAPVCGQTVSVAPLVTLTSDADERVRLKQLFGDSAAQMYLLRSASRESRLIPVTGSSFHLGIIGPELRTIHNSAIPYSLNDGPLWAGRGWNQEMSGGLFLNAPHLQIIAAPTFIDEQNEIFQVIPYPQTSGAHPGTPPRSLWANPFHPLPESIDLPLRFGDSRHRRIDPGQSSATIDAGDAAFGFATENLWWGPGIENAITLSNNAPGFPHLFAKTAHPIQTRAGSFDAQWILGRLNESDYFDFNASNNTRSLSGAALTWRTPVDSGLTFGLARLVMGARSNNAFPVGAAFDFLRTVGHADADTLAPVGANARDQITSLFGRWVLAPAHFEVYAEWARFEEPISLRDFLEYPGHSEGYTLGFQWAHPLSHDRTFRLQSEASYLEPDPSFRLRNVYTTYTSRAVPQGFTERGQSLGAAIGPGASDQWLSADVFSPRWRLGVHLGRIRWDNGVLFEPIVPQFKFQDVTLSGGLRASVSWSGVTADVDFTHAARFNYLFQAYTLGPLQLGGIDLLNNSLSLTISTAVLR
jgi:hypothetical protein